MKCLNKLQVILVSVVLTGLLSFSSATAFADDYFTKWKQNFGGNGDDYFTSATALRDSHMFLGYVAAGYSASNSFGNGNWTGVMGKGGNDAIIVRYERQTDAYDNIKWSKNFGGSGGDLFWAVTVVSDGYVAAGYSAFSSFGNGDWTGVTGKGDQDAIIVKFDEDGNVVWGNHFGGSGQDTYYAITTVSDGVVAVGNSKSGSFGNGDWTGVTGKGGQDAIIVKYDNDGNVVWKKNFGGSGDDGYNYITEVSDGFVVVGFSTFQSFGNGDWTGVLKKGDQDAIIVKYDNDGNVVWKKNFGGSGAGGVFVSVAAVSDGCIAVGESAASSFGNGDWTDVSGKGGSNDAIIVKYDNAGDVVWKKNFGGSGYDYFASITEVYNGLLAVGNSSSGSFNTGDWTGIMGKGGYDATMVKYDYDGNVVWRGNFGGSGDDKLIWSTESLKGFIIIGQSSEPSFGNGDWEDTEGKGGHDAVTIEFTPLAPPILIPVTDITNVPTKTKVGVPLTLSGKIVPGNATYQVFSWELKDAGATDATISNDNILNTINTGAVIVTAIIENGAGIGENFTKDFIIAVNPEDFVSVTDIVSVPTATTVTIPLTLTGTVVPENATNKAIAWSVKDAGTTNATITGGNILNTTAIGTVIVTATIEVGVGPSVDFAKDFIIAVNPADFISVTDIINVPQFTIVETPLTLTGTVVPSSATNKTIIWSMKNAGSTGATISGNILNPTEIAGKVIVTATIIDGTGTGIDFTKDFTIAINPEDFIPVTDIIDLPTSATEKIPLTLTGTVIPDNANNKNISWSVKDKGTTNATITGGILKTTAAGVAVVRATVKDGIGAGVPFIKEFDVIVEEVVVDIVEIPQSNTTLKAYTQRGILYVSGLTVGKIWRVYNILGELIYQSTATAEEANISLPISGMYIILSEDRVTKVVND